MKNDFDIEFVKLKNGIHSFEYRLNDLFFEEFANSEINGANVNVKLEITKSDSLMIADLHCDGVLKLACDRCLGTLDYPVTTQFKTIYHLNAAVEKIDEASEVNVDIVYLNASQYKINVATSIYESFLPALPMVKKCEDVANGRCDEDMLQRLSKEYTDLSQPESSDPRWDELKKWLEQNKK